MNDVILAGRSGQILEVPAAHWHEHLEQARRHPSERLAFMTPDHHRVRNFAVTQLPRNHGKALSPEDIAARLQLPLPTVEMLLEDLQAHLFFLVLNPVGEVNWAFPVTTDETPHRLRFSSGEQIYAA